MNALRKNVEIILCKFIHKFLKDGCAFVSIKVTFSRY